MTASSVISKHQNDRATYADLDARSNALALGLDSVGVRTGDRIGVMLGNSMEYSVVCGSWILTHKCNAMGLTVADLLF